MTFGAVVGLVDLPTSAQILLGLLAGALGACLASFLAVVMERVPEGESIAGYQTGMRAPQQRARPPRSR